MGLRCLLGHDFAEPELERERQEEGDEVVVSVRETKTCTRCGYSQIVSENKEITTLDQLAASAEAADEAAAGGDEPSADGTSGTPASAADAGDADDSFETAEILDASDGAGERSEPSADSVDAAADRPEVDFEETDDERYDDPESDDGLILDDGEEPAADRRPGEWPDAPDETPSGESSGPSPWPEHDSDAEDEGYAAEFGDDEDDEEGAFEFSGLAPEVSDRDSPGRSSRKGFDAEFVDGPEESSEGEETGHDGFTRARSVSTEPSADEERSEYFCPECGLSRAAGASSMRAGDICPECRRGYIGERPV